MLLWENVAMQKAGVCTSNTGNCVDMHVLGTLQDETA